MTQDEASIEAGAAVQANERIRDFAQTAVADRHSVWEFVCECGRPGCAERVTVTIALYDELRDGHRSVLARGHLPTRARAFPNQAQRRFGGAEHRRSLRTGPYPEMVCDECGYGVCVRDPPLACPMCRSTAWRLRR